MGIYCRPAEPVTKLTADHHLGYDVVHVWTDGKLTGYLSMSVEDAEGFASALRGVEVARVRSIGDGRVALTSFGEVDKHDCLIDEYGRITCLAELRIELAVGEDT
jgi:hypothetical protein